MSRPRRFLSDVPVALKPMQRPPASDASGNAAVEFSLLLPILVFLGIGIVDFGTGTYRQMQVQQAAQVGAEYAVNHGFDANAVAQAVVDGTSFSEVKANPAPTSYYGCVSGSTIIVAQADDTCADGTSPGTYTTVYASGVYGTEISYTWIPSQFSLTGIATVRLK